VRDGRRNASSIGQRRRTLGRRNVYLGDAIWRVSGYLTACGAGNGIIKQILSEEWIPKWRPTPTVAQPTYGFMNWFLNTDKKLYPSAPEIFTTSLRRLSVAALV
jgi:hypothetical protein